jgi:hypothetical protein
VREKERERESGGSSSERSGAEAELVPARPDVGRAATFSAVVEEEGEEKQKETQRTSLIFQFHVKSFFFRRKNA